MRFQNKDRCFSFMYLFFFILDPIQNLLDNNNSCRASEKYYAVCVKGMHCRCATLRSRGITIGN